jgi:putative acetyltransferase
MGIRGAADSRIRPIQARDDQIALEIVREVRREFVVVGFGFDSHEPDEMALSRTYAVAGSAYFVVEIDGTVCGGGGFARFAGQDLDVCELQRMYLVSCARGRGLGERLLQRCLSAARTLGYRQCYLETATALNQANRLYEKAGFRRLAGPLAGSEHPACDAYLLLNLS